MHERLVNTGVRIFRSSQTLLHAVLQHKKSTGRSSTSAHPDVGREPHEQGADQHERGEGNERGSQTEALDHHASAEQREQEGNGVRGLNSNNKNLRLGIQNTSP